MRPTCRRRGATTVEAAFVLPVFIFFLFGMMQVGHALMIQHFLRGACREAARYGSTEGVSTSEAQAYAVELISGVVLPENVQVIIRDASVYDQEEGDLPESSTDYDDMPDIELSNAESRQLFLIRAMVNYNDVAFLNLHYARGLKLSGMAFMRHE